jgi:hypothetical protein
MVKDTFDAGTGFTAVGVRRVSDWPLAAVGAAAVAVATAPINMLRLDSSNSFGFRM